MCYINTITSDLRTTTQTAFCPVPRPETPVLSWPVQMTPHLKRRCKKPFDLSGLDDAEACGGGWWAAASRLLSSVFSSDCSGDFSGDSPACHFGLVSTVLTLPNLFSALVKIIEAVLDSYFTFFTFLIGLLIKM